MSRVFHIDAIRGVAILMMLQGHFVDTLLQDADRVGYAHDLWKFCRGLTAPVFYTTAGIIVVYLLLRKTDPVYQQFRLKKALWRGLEVMMWGYLLRFNMWPYLIDGAVYPELWRVDVLQCIGLGLLLMGLTFFLIGRFSITSFKVSVLVIALFFFMIEPILASIDYSNWVPGIRNYFTMKYGSIFSVSPFLGYVFVGGFLGSLYTVFYFKSKYWFIGGMVVFGLMLSLFSSWALIQIYLMTDIELFKAVAWNNVGLVRLGQVLLIYSVFMMAEPWLIRLKTLNFLGQNTLTVYIIHFFVLFGSLYGLGIDDILFEKRSLPAEAVIPGALIFVVGVSWLTIKYHKWKDAGFPLSRS